MRFTARARLETWAHASRVQSEEVVYDLERTVVGSVVAGVTADRCGQCGACDRAVASVAMGNGEVGDMAVIDVLDRAQAWLQAADERGINVTDENGYLAVIADLVAEVETQRGTIEGYRNTYQGVRAHRVLLMAVEAMMAPLGYHGSISARDDRVQAVMDALAQIDSEERG